MALTNNDVTKIRKALRPDFDKLEKGQKRIENKFDELFDYLDKDVSAFKRKTAQHLGIPVSELSPAP